MKLFIPLLFLFLETSAGIKVRLTNRRPPLYIAPEYDEQGVGQNFEYDIQLTEHVAVDQKRGLVYAAGSDQITVMKFSRQRTLEVIHAEKFPGKEFKMIQVCRGFVTVTARDTANPADGRILVFRPFRKRSRNLTDHLIQSIVIGPEPDHHVNDRRCRRTIVAVEGSGDAFDGAIGIITYGIPRFGAPQVKTLGFSSFASQLPELQSQWFVLDPTTTRFTSSVEPEWVCINKKQTKAYVSLQDNNGLAVVDLKPGKERIKKIMGLDLKDWSVDGGTEGFDGIKDPEEINLMHAPVFSAYMPDSIDCQTIRNKDCVILANEGDLFDSIKTTIGESDTFPGIEIGEAYDDLRIMSDETIADQNPDDGVLDFIVMAGGRSFGMRCDDSTLVDTGSDLEQRIASDAETRLLFNSDPDPDETISDSFDDKSAREGPEPESVVTFRACKGRYIVMIGSMESPGFLIVYTLDTHNIGAGFQFQQLLHGYDDLSDTLTEEQLYEARKLSLRDPEGLRLITGKGFRKRPMLVVASAITSTIDLFDISISCHVRNNPPPIDLPETDEGPPERK